MLLTTSLLRGSCQNEDGWIVKGHRSCKNTYKEAVEVISGDGKYAVNGSWRPLTPPRDGPGALAKGNPAAEFADVPGIGDLLGDDVSTNKACTPRPWLRTTISFRGQIQISTYILHIFLKSYKKQKQHLNNSSSELFSSGQGRGSKF